MDIIEQEFKKICAQYPDLEALVSKDDRVYTFKEYYQYASAFAKSAIKIGLQPKDGVGIIGFNSPEYHFALHGTWLANGVTAGIYTTNNEEACKYVLAHSESVICVCQSGKQFTKISSLREQLPLLKAIVVYWPDVDLPVLGEKCVGFDIQRMIELEN